MTLFPEVIRMLKERGAADVVVFGGGIIPEDDARQLATLGVKAIFTPGATTEEIIKWVRDNVHPRA
jgi:methylmalonyl-CoA mutase C-terminal domain/subunit